MLAVFWKMGVSGAIWCGMECLRRVTGQRVVEKELAVHDVGGQGELLVDDGALALGRGGRAGAALGADRRRSGRQLLLADDRLDALTPLKRRRARCGRSLARFCRFDQIHCYSSSLMVAAARGPTALIALTENGLDGGGWLLVVVLVPLLLLHDQVEVLDDLLGFDVEVGLDVADGALLALRLPQQRLLRRHQLVHRALGAHQNVPYLPIPIISIHYHHSLSSFIKINRWRG